MSGRPWSAFMKYCERSLSSLDHHLTASVLLSSADAILATINDNCLPGDKCGIIACQKEHCACDIPGFSQPLDGLLLPGAAFLLFRLGRGCLCIRQAGQHRVRGDAVVCNVVRQASHEPDDSHLCSDVVAHAGYSQA